MLVEFSGVCPTVEHPEAILLVYQRGLDVDGCYQDSRSLRFSHPDGLVKRDAQR